MGVRPQMNPELSSRFSSRTGGSLLAFSTLTLFSFSTLTLVSFTLPFLTFPFTPFTFTALSALRKIIQLSMKKETEKKTHLGFIDTDRKHLVIDLLVAYALAKISPSPSLH